MKLIFLDIDGVLNSHKALAANGINTINRDLMDRFNRIVAETGAHVVISSAWRYMVHRGAMTLDGFRYMLMTHGLSSDAVIHGCTCSDEAIHERGQQITFYLNLYARPQYVVLDDGGDEPQRNGARTLTQSLLHDHADAWVKTDGATGLDDACVQYAVALLNQSFR